MKKFIPIIILLLIASLANAAPIIFTPTGVTVTAIYIEPSTNTDTSPLLDLAKTSIYFQIVGASPTKAKDITATTPTGSGNINTTFDIPITEGQEKDIDCWATATDLSGNESAKSNIVRIRIDRLAPSPPQ